MDVSDISMVDDIPVFLLQYNDEDDETFDEKYSDEREGRKTFKTEDSQRVLPIHPDLIDIGLYQYIDFLKGKNQVKLFPELKYRKTSAPLRTA